ncbi:MAG: FecR family protein, partial [Myxococcaceae bacterium]|nr:FecR family protein [Myxococcaceae bacterium]
MTAGLVLAAAAAVAFVVTRPADQAAPAAVPAVASAVVPAHLERAEGVRRAGLTLPPGAEVAAGDVLETQARGSAVIAMPDGSAAKLGALARLRLASASPSAVELELERGAVVVEATHRDARTFVVRSGHIAVHVVGTRFQVAQRGRGTEVQVAQGLVRVEAPHGSVVEVAAGEAVWIAGDGSAVRRGVLSPAQSAALVVSPPPLVQASGGARGSPTQERLARVLRQDAEDEAVARREARPPVKAAAAESPPSAGPAAPATDEGEWAPMPSAPAPQPPPADATTVEWSTPEGTPWEGPPPVAEPEPVGTAQGAPVTVEAIPTDVEGIFLKRAERALRRGSCERYLLGLSELALDRGRAELAGRSRILRARCYDAKLRPELAEPEYRRYLEDFPAGPYASEARAALTDQ